MVVLGLGLSACTVSFELTSQRTALENQVMGSFKELEDELVLMSAVRAPGSARAASPQRQRALDARQNQSFNRDDIDELKDLGLIGETADGTVAIVPSAKAAETTPARAKLATELVSEENRDRNVIWQRIIEMNENLSAKDLGEVRKTYAKTQREGASTGHWYQTDGGTWVQK